jgi:2-haloacid dehalogenase
MRKRIVFDVNETLLDLTPVRRWFSERFDKKPDASIWFAELLRLSFVSAATDRYTPFPALGSAALETVAQRCGARVDAEDTAKLGELFASLPAHSEVADGLRRLVEAGFTVAALTNSPQSTAEKQLGRAGIADLFQAIMSVDMVNRLKPHRSVYLAGANHLGAQTSDVVMVAAHDWDVAGAMAAGCDGVFINRPNQMYSSSFERPTMTASDVNQAATAIIAAYGP